MINEKVKENVVDVISHWTNLAQLCEFALNRHGYGDSDGGFGITYESDLDDYDRQVDRISIPQEHLLVYGFWGEPDGYELFIKEVDYLLVLAEVLDSHDLKPEAEKILGKVREIS